jgi:choline-sulfatase
VPWFLWLHYFDPHAPYLAHEGISEAFGTEEALDLYDGEIAFTDRHLGRLFDAFERLGFAQNTVVVLVADHGEEFGEHGEKGHGYDLHEEVVHVPLVVRAPGLAPRRVPDVVPTVDVFPTLLELCVAKAQTEIEGRSLAPLLRGAADPPREACSEARWKFQHDITSLTRGNWKYIDSHRREDVSEMLFDHAVDPAETKNLLKDHPDRAAELRAGLRARIERAKALGAGYERHETTDMTPSERKRMEDLGYTGDAAGDEER